MTISLQGCNFIDLGPVYQIFLKRGILVTAHCRKLHGFCDFLKPRNCRKRPVMINVLLIKKSSKCIEPCFIPWPVTRIHIFQKEMKNFGDTLLSLFLPTPNPGLHFSRAPILTPNWQDSSGEKGDPVWACTKKTHGPVCSHKRAYEPPAQDKVVKII